MSGDERLHGNVMVAIIYDSHLKQWAFVIMPKTSQDAQALAGMQLQDVAPDVISYNAAILACTSASLPGLRV